LVPKESYNHLLAPCIWWTWFRQIWNLFRL